MKKKMSFLRRTAVKTASVLSDLFIENHLLQVSKYQIVSKKIPTAFNGLKIVQLSDLHSKSFGRDNARLLRKIDAEKPDFIVMTGDMVTRTDETHRAFFQTAETLGKKYPCYYVIGNHEQNMEAEELKFFCAKLMKLGIHVMNNEKVIIQRKNQNINLYGMWFPLKYYKEAKHHSEYTPFCLEDMTGIMGSCDPERYAILLTHSPLCFETYAKWGADLTFCGHVHGGMIRLPFLGGLLSPDREFFPQYSAGLYERREKKLLVSRGLGSGVFGVRIFNCPDIVAVTLFHDASV